MSLHYDLLSTIKRYHNKIDELIEPIRDFFDITTILYFEVSSENKLIYLTNNYRWAEHYINNKYYLYDPHIVVPRNIGSGHVVWSTNWNPYYDDENYLKTILADLPTYNISNGLTWIDKNKRSYKAYIFGSDSKNKALHPKIYGNINLIKHYIHYFSQEIQSIKQLYNPRLDLVELRGDSYFKQKGVIDNDINNETQKYLFLQQIKLLDTDLLNIKLTNREIQCIHLYLRGNVAQDTADILAISRRTVETHMNNIKTKLKINYKKDLIKKFQILKELDLV